GKTVGRRVGERDENTFGLGAVDAVAENPAAATEALPVAAIAAIAAPGTGGDARHQDAVADGDVTDVAADVLDRADGLVTQYAPGLDGGDVAVEDVQVGAADGDAVDADDGIVGVRDRGIRNVLPRPATRAVVNERLHRRPLSDRAAGTDDDTTTGRHRGGANGPSDGERVRLLGWAATPGRDQRRVGEIEFAGLDGGQVCVDLGLVGQAGREQFVAHVVDRRDLQ